MSLHFIVHGRPTPKGSKRGVPIRHRSGRVGIAVIERPEVRTWEGIVAGAGADAMTDADLDDFRCRDGLLDGALSVVLIFAMQRPGAHYRSGKHRHELRPDAPVYPNVKPDIDKLTRGVLDALIGTVIVDDCRIVALTAMKTYSTPIGVDVVLSPA